MVFAAGGLEMGVSCRATLPGRAFLSTSALFLSSWYLLAVLFKPTGYGTPARTPAPS
jgi:hypothetical protein